MRLAPRSTALASLVAAVLWTAAALLATPALAAETDPAILEMRAEDLAAQDRCPEAIRLIDEAGIGGAEGARLLLVRGQCEIRLGRYTEATATLERARSLDPALGDAALYEGVALFHAGDLDRAYEVLEAARGHTTNEAELELYTGLVLVEQAEHRDAALALERARTGSPGTVEPAASYYAGLAWNQAEDQQRAREALDRVRELDPDGIYGTQAEEALSRMQPAGRAWASATAGLEWDSNVVLLGNDEPLPGDISDEADGRGVWTVEGGAELFRTADWSGGILGSYSGTAQFDLHEFDTNYPVGTVWIDREFGASSRARLRYDIGYAWVDYDPFLFSQDATALFWHDWGAVGETELSAGYYWNDFRYDQLICPWGLFPFDCLDRSGDGVVAGVEHRVPVGDRNSVRGGFLFDRYWSDGTEYDSFGYTFSLGFAVMLPLDLLLDAEGSYTYQPYENPSVFGVLEGEFDDRTDDVWRVHAYLGRAFGRYVTVSAQYRYTNDNSNVSVYAYDRHIVGGYVTVYVR